MDYSNINAQNTLDLFDFFDAVFYLRQGINVCLKHWQGNGFYIKMGQNKKGERALMFVNGKEEQ